MRVYGLTGHRCKPFDDLPAEHIAAAAFVSRFFGRRLVDGLCVAVREESRLHRGLDVLHAAGHAVSIGRDENDGSARYSAMPRYTELRNDSGLRRGGSIVWVAATGAVNRQA